MIQVPSDGIEVKLILFGLTTIASVSGALNMLFLRLVIGEVRQLRSDQSETRETVASHSTDIDWIKRSLGRPSQERESHA